MVAVQRGTGDKKETGFQVIVGGGLGWDPYVGQELFSFIPENRVMDVSRAIALTFRDHGDRFNRATSRMKFVVQRQGIEKVREYVLGFLKAEGKSVDGLETAAITETGKPVPDRPLTLPQPPARDGTVTVDILVPKGELTFRQFASVADLAEAYGDQRVRTTNRQNLSIHGVSPQRVAALKTEIQALGFATEGFYGLKDIVPCVGTTYCPKAVAETRRLHDLLLPVVSQDKYKSIEQSALINIAGCPNSCSPWRIADLGFRGMRIREDQGSVEGFEMRVGGGLTRLGQYLGEFKVTDIPGIVETVLDTFLQVKHPQETLQDCVARLGVEPFSKAVFA
jgi:sulfite reductase beta subunit-like hemoprotein